MPSVDRHLPLWKRVAPALGLFFFAPFTAEYLIGYDPSTGHFPELLAGLLIFGPLYGAPALLIREVARRRGRGWPTMLLLAAAFGVLQPGLVDHSLFNTSYGDLEGWQEEMTRTYIPVLGIGADNALTFIVGHVVWSIGVPIALFEAFVPRRRTTPWLGWFGLAVTAVLYVLASALIFDEHVKTEGFLPSRMQLAGSAFVVLALVAAAFLVDRHPRPPVEGAAPTPWRAGGITFLALSIPTALEAVLDVGGVMKGFMATWPGVVLRLVLLAALVILVDRWRRQHGWSASHPLALAGGALLTNTWIAFLVPPLGPVTMTRKLTHNVVFACGAVLLLALGARALRRHEQMDAAANESPSPRPLLDPL